MAACSRCLPAEATQQRRDGEHSDPRRFRQSASNTSNGQDFRCLLNTDSSNQLLYGAAMKPKNTPRVLFFFLLILFAPTSWHPSSSCRLFSPQNIWASGRRVNGNLQESVFVAETLIQNVHRSRHSTRWTNSRRSGKSLWCIFNIVRWPQCFPLHKGPTITVTEKCDSEHNVSLHYFQAQRVELVPLQH